MLEINDGIVEVIHNYIEITYTSVVNLFIYLLMWYYFRKLINLLISISVDMWTMWIVISHQFSNALKSRRGTWWCHMKNSKYDMVYGMACHATYINEGLIMISCIMWCTLMTTKLHQLSCAWHHVVVIIRCSMIRWEQPTFLCWLTSQYTYLEHYNGVFRCIHWVHTNITIFQKQSYYVKITQWWNHIVKF